MKHMKQQGKTSQAGGSGGVPLSMVACLEFAGDLRQVVLGRWFYARLAREYGNAVRRVSRLKACVTYATPTVKTFPDICLRGPGMHD